MTFPRDRTCPLCGSTGPFATLGDVRKRRHQVCPDCRLVFVNSEYLPEREAEKKRYATHQNGPHDAGYVSFLQQALDPALPYLTPDMHGLDYGCGHVPTLSGMLEKRGLQCQNYDIFFFPEFPKEPFNFIFATEVVEHFFHPLEQWTKLVSLLKPGGILIVMTAPWSEDTDWALWGYASDETHVCFYHRKTLDWIFERFGLELLDGSNPRVSVLRRH